MHNMFRLSVAPIFAVFAVADAHALLIEDGVVLTPPGVLAQVVNPGQPVAGKSQLDLSQEWWQWALSIPAATNPLVDTTGEFAQTNNNGPVFFVAGNLGGYLNRAFNVPVGKPLFFPVVNNIDIEFDVSPPATNCFDPSVPDALTCALDFISPGLNNASGLFATLDGQDLLTYPSFRQTSTSFFDFSLPPGNLFGVDAGAYPAIAVSDGYWVALAGLSPGEHVLTFGGTYPALPTPEIGMSITITAVPEPQTYALMLSGLAWVGWFARRRTR